MGARRWAWVGGVVLAAVVGWSIFNQLTRPATLGQRVRSALQKSPAAPRLGSSPVLIDYTPGRRGDVILLQTPQSVLAIGRDVRCIELAGDVRVVAARDANDDHCIRLVAPGRLADIPRNIERIVIETGPGAWTLALDAPRYHLKRDSGGGAVHALAEAPLSPEAETALTQALAPALSWRVNALEVIAGQRAALRGQTEFDLFQELLAGDTAFLDRATSVDAACRRALALLLFPRPEVALRWPDDAAFALTDAHRLFDGDSCVRVFGFELADRSKLAWHAAVYSRPDLAAEALRRVIDGLVPATR